jgi:hypothetical protein
MYTLDHAHLAIAFFTLILTLGVAGCHPHQDADASAAHPTPFLPPAAAWAVSPAELGPVYIGERFSAEQWRMTDRAADAPAPGF